MVVEKHAQTFTHHQLVVNYHNPDLLRCWLHCKNGGLARSYSESDWIMKWQQGPDNGGLCPFVWQLYGIFRLIKWQDPAKPWTGLHDYHD
jgi:hypothetical protein